MDNLFKSNATKKRAVMKTLISEKLELKPKKY